MEPGASEQRRRRSNQQEVIGNKRPAFQFVFVSCVAIVLASLVERGSQCLCVMPNHVEVGRCWPIGF